MFKRKWQRVILGLIVLCIGSIAFFLKPKTETQEPIKTYKAITPVPKTSPIKETNKEETDITTAHNHDHSHGHSHETAPHSHAEKTSPNSGEYDWRDDSAFDVTPPKNDPWSQTFPESESIDAAKDTYPPRDWYKTKDPELRAEYLYAQLIKQFGDTPEVQAIGDYELKVARGTPPTLEEYTDYLEAHYHLFPNENNRRTLEYLRKVIASGNEIIFE